MKIIKTSLFLLSLFSAVLLTSCYDDSTPKIVRPIIDVDYVYFYDYNLVDIKDSTCVLVGKVDDLGINRSCKINNGEVIFGTRNVFNKDRYNFNIDVFLCDTLFLEINEKKDVFVKKRVIIR